MIANFKCQRTDGLAGTFDSSFSIDRASLVCGAEEIVNSLSTRGSSRAVPSEKHLVKLVGLPNLLEKGDTGVTGSQDFAAHTN